MYAFLQLFENSMLGTSDYNMASTVINCSYAYSTDLVMPHFLNKTWIYEEAKNAIIYEFCSKDNLISVKTDF